MLTINHVMIHAILEAVYTKLGLVDEIVHDIESHKRHPDYARAWEIVKKEGYENILAQIKKRSSMTA